MKPKRSLPSSLPPNPVGPFPLPRFETTPTGIIVAVPHGWVELAVDRESALRLSVTRARPSRPRRSIFLDPKPSAAEGRWVLIQDGPMIGIATRLGALFVNPGDGSWALRNATGDTLVRPVPLRPDQPMPVEPGEIQLLVGWKRDTRIAGYGTGNGALSLLQSEGTSHVGNGRAVVPLLWCPQGYAMLAVTEDDVRPASWRGDPERQAVVWTFPGREAHLHLMPAATLKDAALALAALTGAAPVPPRWTLGYLQSRWGWQSGADLVSTLKEFRGRGFPVDAFILDFEWYTEEPDYEVPAEGLRKFPDFRANPELFPDPRAQLAEFHAQGLRIVAIRKPRLGDADTLREMRARGWMLGHAPTDARKWSVREIDFRQPRFREWYAERLAPLVEAGFDAWWNDEGESSFTTYAYWNLAELELWRNVRPRLRFWSLNRAFSPGLQRLGATAWTGDAYATWEALAATPTHLLNWGLAGMPYGGCDIGGFRGEATPELFVRWIQAGVFFPMMRAHTSHEWTPRFPWRFGAEAEPALRKALELRYRLIPYLYSLAHETQTTGLPVMRPLVMEFPQDPLVADYSQAWMVGDRLLAAPMLSPGTRRSVYMPAESWFAFGTHEQFDGGRVVEVKAALEEIPLFVRAGTILPLGPVVPSTAALPGGPLEVHVYPGRDASFTLVEDDGTTNDYLDGSLRRVTFHWDDARRELSWTIAGSYDGPSVFRTIRVRLHGGGPASEPTEAALGTTTAEVCCLCLG